jgi:predicted permease
LLVSLQLALSLPLLVGAGLLARTIYNLQHVELGFPVERLVTLQVDTRGAGYEGARRTALVDDLVERMRRIPGVKAVSFSHDGVFTGSRSGDQVEVEGFTPKDEKEQGSERDNVGPGYFSTLGIPVILGREILKSDTAASPRIAVINEAFAKMFFAGRNPMGMRITTVFGDERTTQQVVGVVKDSRTEDLREQIAPRYYTPATQPLTPRIRTNLLIRTSTEPSPVLTAARRTIQQAYPSLPILSPETLKEKMVPFTAQERSVASLAVVFGAVALMLAAVGLYGVLSFAITRRQGEIAIRIAVGARPGSVIAMILRETSGLILVGLALGAGLAYAASRWITSQLYGVAPQDPLTLTLAAGMLVVVALLATFLPAQQASRLDPMAALRRE